MWSSRPLGCSCFITYSVSRVMFTVLTGLTFTVDFFLMTGSTSSSEDEPASLLLCRPSLFRRIGSNSDYMVFLRRRFLTTFSCTDVSSSCCFLFVLPVNMFDDLIALLSTIAFSVLFWEGISMFGTFFFFCRGSSSSGLFSFISVSRAEPNFGAYKDGLLPLLFRFIWYD